MCLGCGGCGVGVWGEEGVVCGYGCGCVWSEVGVVVFGVRRVWVGVFWVRRVRVWV